MSSSPDDSPSIKMKNALMNGNIEQLDTLLKSGVSPNIEIEYTYDRYDVNVKTNPLFVASLLNNVDMVKLLLKAGANVNIQETKYKHTPLIRAVYDTSINNPELIELLLKNGANVNIKDNKKMNAFHYALLNEKTKIIKILLTAPGIDLNMPWGDNVKSPLITFLTERLYGWKKIVPLLLEAPGIQVNGTDPTGKTPLIIATEYDDHFLLRKVLKAGADVNIKDMLGDTALIIAAENESLDIVEELLKAGADINIKDNKGYTPLRIATVKKILDIVEELLKAGADVNIKDNNGDTPLSLAVKSLNVDIIKEFLKVPGIKITKELYTKATPEIKEILSEYISKWKGWTRSDVEKFDTIFSTQPDAKGVIVANDYSCCPVCLEYVERSEACMYVKHNCTLSGRLYHEKLYNEFKHADGQIHWCTICGRIATTSTYFEDGLEMANHRHIRLSKHDAESREFAKAGNAFEKDCRKTSGGGGLPEKLARFHRMREYAFELQKLMEEGKTFYDDEVHKKMVEEAWDAPIGPRDRVKKMIKNKHFNIPSSNFLPNMRTDVNEKIANYENVRWPNKNKPEAQPILEASGFNAPGMEDKVPVIRFRHRQPDGTIHIHKDDELVGKAGLYDTIAQYATNFANENFGQCFAYPSCKGMLYPEELEQFVVKDPANPKDMECLPKEMFDKYKLHFNQRFAPKGGRRKTRKLKQKGGGGDFFQPATNAVCDLPKKKGGRRSRKTRKQKQVYKKTRKNK